MLELLNCEILKRIKVKRYACLLCHSGLSGIFLYFKKDSRRASLAGMTKYEAILMNSLVISGEMT